MAEKLGNKHFSINLHPASLCWNVHFGDSTQEFDLAALNAFFAVIFGSNSKTKVVAPLIDYTLTSFDVTETYAECLISRC